MRHWRFSHNYKEGIFAHFSKKENLRIIGDYIQPTKWDSLKTNCSHVSILPKCAVDEWGLDAKIDRNQLQSQSNQPTEIIDDKSSGYLKVAKEYDRTLHNFLTQALSPLVWNTTIGKAFKKADRKTKIDQLTQAGLSIKDQWLSILNLEDFCKCLPAFQQQVNKIFSERSSFDDHTKLYMRELSEVPKLCLLWREFLERPNSSRDAVNRIRRLKRLSAIDAEDTLAEIRESC